MPSDKTDKELAFLYDLYVATDWGERFAEQIDEHVVLPKKGSILYLGAGTGGHALALKVRAGKDVEMVGVDESPEQLELARAKALSVDGAGETEWRHEQLEALTLPDDSFDLVICDASLVAPERLPEIVAEMARVAAPGGSVALNVTTASSFGEFFSIYWEALAGTGFEAEAEGVAALVKDLPVVSEVEQLAAREGIDDVRSWTRVEEFNYKNGDEFLNAPLVKEFLLDSWLELLPGDDERARALAEVERLIDEERHEEMDFFFSIKATLIVGRKAD